MSARNSFPNSAQVRLFLENVCSMCLCVHWKTFQKMKFPRFYGQFNKQRVLLLHNESNGTNGEHIGAQGAHGERRL